jgi:uncharacterized NAD-dependent epimerase/dehydratase family protein
MQKSNAIVITGGYLDTINAKTAHGLIRGTERFNVLAVIDHKFPGRDAGDVLEKKSKNIPVYATLVDALNTIKEPIQYAVIGIATKGGVIPDMLRSMIKDALENNLSIVNGLHDYVSDNEELSAIAKQRGLEIIDVRKPKKFKDLHFWSGKIAEVKCPKIAVLGTDCALGKRTTTRFLMEAMRDAGYKAEMIYTGQTGWMQGAGYGFIFDSTLNDFISGEMEHAVWQCYQEKKPDIIFIEGQSSLRNPSGPAGSEWIISAAADAAVLQHNPARKQFKDLEFYPAYLPSLKDEIELIKIYGAPTVAIMVNTMKMTEAEGKAAARQYENELGIPAVLPLEEGMDRLVPIFEKMIQESNTH